MYCMSQKTISLDLFFYKEPTHVIKIDMQALETKLLKILMS